MNKIDRIKQACEESSYIKDYSKKIEGARQWPGTWRIMGEGMLLELEKRRKECVEGYEQRLNAALDRYSTITSMIADPNYALDNNLYNWWIKTIDDYLGREVWLPEDRLNVDKKVDELKRVMDRKLQGVPVVAPTPAPEPTAPTPTEPAPVQAPRGRAREVAPPSPPKQYGTLSINVSKPADVRSAIIVRVNRRRVGSPPLSLRVLEGTHNVTISLRGYSTISKKVTITPNETVTITEAFT